VMTRVVGLYPDIAQARMGRGVLLARLGKRAEAHEEARKVSVHGARVTAVQSGLGRGTATRQI